MLSVWGSIEVRECYKEVEAGDEGRFSIAQDILCKSTEFQGRLFAPTGGAGVLPCRTCALIVTAFRLRTTFGGSPLGMGRNRAAGRVRHVAARMIGGYPNRIFGHTRWYGSPRSKSFLGSCGTTGSLAEGWRQSGGDIRHRCVGGRNGRAQAQEVHFRRQPASSESGRPEPGNKV